MEKNDKEKWIADAFDSIKGSKRAKPSAELFAKIERHIDAPEDKIIPMQQWRYAIAVAALLLMVNIFAMRQFTKNNESNTGEMVVSEVSSESLISDYKIYE